MKFLFLVRLNAAAIPTGMLFSDSPKLLRNVHISESTLLELPQSLSSLWPKQLRLHIDYVNWTSVLTCCSRLNSPDPGRARCAV
ncbi:TPA: hypothetical protein N0F65_000860 [Lagenidium giganteum]|uniref:Uncharacterized protein n=1 Tax=Lagenidium giganteum TaxID=4803 RepID=A0AAV2YJ04_9STRA|nr:TPA: hypothetical protein N0F65_000860 [Lagenidium giganteum]